MSKDFVTFVQDLALGGVSGCIAKTANAPLERVKILLQTQSSNAAIANADKYKGIVDCMTRVKNEQGVKAFWRGNMANCLRYFPTQAMNFAFKAKYQKLFVRPKEEVGFFLWFSGYLAAGGAAGATALTVSYPLEFAYTRLAADVGAAKAGTARMYTGTIDCLVKTAKSADGIRGIYRGYGPSVAGIIVYRAGYFGLYDLGKLKLMPMLGLPDHGVVTILAKFTMALGIDIFSALCAYPLDTVRRRLMMQSGQSEKLYTTALGAAKHVMKHEGFSGFYTGALMNSIRAMGSALVLVLYDELRHVLIEDAAPSGH